MGAYYKVLMIMVTETTDSCQTAYSRSENLSALVASGGRPPPVLRDELGDTSMRDRVWGTAAYRGGDDKPALHDVVVNGSLANTAAPDLTIVFKAQSSSKLHPVYKPRRWCHPGLRWMYKRHQGQW